MVHNIRLPVQDVSYLHREDADDQLVLSDIVRLPIPARDVDDHHY